MKILLSPDSYGGAGAGEQIAALTATVNKLTEKMTSMENIHMIHGLPSPADVHREPKKKVTITNGAEYYPPGWKVGQPFIKGIGGRPWIHKVGTTWEFPASHANQLILHGLAVPASPDAKCEPDPDALPASPSDRPAAPKS